MAESSETPRGMYLPTGWRVVGRGAERVVERVAVAVGARVAPGDVADTLYALQCTMDRTIRARPAVERVLDALTDEVRRAWPDCPRLLRDSEVEHPPSRFGGARYVVSSESGNEWLGEIVWRAPHPIVAGAAITTRVLLEEKPLFTRLGVRVTADAGAESVRGFVGAGQAQPAFLLALRRDLKPYWQGGPLTAHALRSGEVEDFVVSTLQSPSRDVPVAVLSPREDGSYVVDPEDLSWDLLGRARLYVIHDHRLTFELSDEVGDRAMSCYWGAARCYFPGWSRHDDPRDHPLLVADRLADPIMRARWLGEIGIWAGVRTKLPPVREAALEPDNAKPSVAGAVPAGSPRQKVEPAASPVLAAERAHGQGAAPPGTPIQLAPVLSDAAADALDIEGHSSDKAQGIAELMPLLEILIQDVRGLGSLVGQLSDEVERLRTISAVRSSSTSAIERRLGRLEDILDHVFPRAGGIAEPGAPGAASPNGPASSDEMAEDDEGRPGLVEVIQGAAETYADAVVFLDSAFSSAADSPYEDPERVRAVLEAMAMVARRRRDGVLGTSLREAFADLGIDYRPAIAKTTSARMREQYRFVQRDGELVEAEEHVVLGNTYDPRRCLRVYFSSRVPNEPRFVIGHVGRHFNVKSTT